MDHRSTDDTIQKVTPHKYMGTVAKITGSRGKRESFGTNVFSPDVEINERNYSDQDGNNLKTITTFSSVRRARLTKINRKRRIILPMT